MPKIFSEVNWNVASWFSLDHVPGSIPDRRVEAAFRGRERGEGSGRHRDPEPRQHLLHQRHPPVPQLHRPAGGILCPRSGTATLFLCWRPEQVLAGLPSRVTALPYTNYKTKSEQLHSCRLILYYISY